MRKDTTKDTERGLNAVAWNGTSKGDSAVTRTVIRTQKPVKLGSEHGSRDEQTKAATVPSNADMPF
jgi:hypothetical protein